MGLQDRIKDSLLKQVIQAMVNRANNKFDMQEIMNKYSAEQRTMQVVITDLDDGYGFAVVGGKMILTNVDSPTCVVSMSKKTFSAIVTGKISQTQAFLMDSVVVTGNSWLRDAILINKIFGELKDTMLRKA